MKKMISVEGDELLTNWS